MTSEMLIYYPIITLSLLFSNLLKQEYSIATFLQVKRKLCLCCCARFVLESAFEDKESDEIGLEKVNHVTEADVAWPCLTPFTADSILTEEKKRYCMKTALTFIEG